MFALSSYNCSRGNQLFLTSLLIIAGLSQESLNEILTKSRIELQSNKERFLGQEEEKRQGVK